MLRRWEITRAYDDGTSVGRSHDLMRRRSGEYPSRGIGGRESGRTARRSGTTIDTIDTLIERLVAARRPGAPRVASDSPLPHGLDDAYRIQSGVAARLGAVGAFKCGRRAPDAVPKLAPVFASDVHADGAQLAADVAIVPAIELEIAFRLIATPPAADDRAFEARLRDRVELLPAFELVGSRLADRDVADEAWQLADNQNNAAVVVGTPLADARGSELDRRDARLVIGGRELHANPATVPGGDAFATFAAFAHALGTHCGGLHVGQVCITGALIGPHPVEAGDRLHGWIDGLGTVDARIAP